MTEVKKFSEIKEGFLKSLSKSNRKQYKFIEVIFKDLDIDEINDENCSKILNWNKDDENILKVMKDNKGIKANKRNFMKSALQKLREFIVLPKLEEVSEEI